MWGCPFLRIPIGFKTGFLRGRWEHRIKLPDKFSGVPRPLFEGICSLSGKRLPAESLNQQGVA